MNNYLIHKVKPLDRIESGLYLVILHASDIPPHIGIIYNEKYFSLTVAGQTLGDDVQVLKKLIHRKKIKTLFIRHVDGLNSMDNIRNTFLEEKRVQGNITCLFPIKKVLAEMYDKSIARVKFIYDVLPVLYKTKSIDAVYHLNMNEEIENGTFSFTRYTMDDILDRIKSYETEELC